MESPGAYLHARRATSRELLTLGATGAAVSLLLTSTGDLFVVVTLLALAALDVYAAGITAAAAVAMLLRWGSSSLAAIAGAQAVLGAGIAVGSAAGTISTGAAALAVLCAAPTGIAAVPYGLTAALFVAGPAATTPSHLAVRVAAGLAGAVVALLVARRADVIVRRRVAAAAAAVAILAAGVA